MCTWNIYLLPEGREVLMILIRVLFFFCLLKLKINYLGIFLYCHRVFIIYYKILFINNTQIFLHFLHWILISPGTHYRLLWLKLKNRGSYSHNLSLGTWASLSRVSFSPLLWAWKLGVFFLFKKWSGWAQSWFWAIKTSSIIE